MMHRQLNGIFPQLRAAIPALIVLLLFIGIGFVKTTVNAESTPSPKPDTSKIIISIEHIVPQGKDCPELRYKNGILQQPCQIDEHWKIKIQGKEKDSKGLQIALMVERAFGGEDPMDRKTPSNRTVLIKPDNSAPWLLVGEVIKACAMAFIWKIEYGAEAIPVYLPKGKGSNKSLDEVRISLIDNFESPLIPTILIGNREQKDQEALYVSLKEMMPFVKDDKIPLKICSDQYVPFQIVLDVIKIIRKCDEVIPIEISAQTPTPPKGGRPEKVNWGQPVNGLQCRINSDKKAYKKGEPIQVAIEIRNGTEDKMTVWNGTFAAGWRMNGKDCQTIDDLPVKKPCKEESQTIMPNEVFKAKEVITNLSIPFSAHYRKKIFKEKGEYQISLELRLYRLNEKDEWESLPILISNTIIIGILNE
ncbi:MAG: hypothetical protein WC980_00740 [Candidatus Brocadiia bacterium]